MNQLLRWAAAAIVILVAAIMPHAARAAEAGEPPKEIDGKPFEEFLNTYAYFDAMAQDVMTYEKNIGPCATPKKIKRVEVGRPQVLAQFSKAGTPPQWLEILTVSGCEKPFDRAVLVVYVDEKVLALPLLGGSGLSRFDVELQQDVIRAVVAGERRSARKAGCPPGGKIRIVTTSLLSKKNGPAGFVWVEEWTVANCKGEKELTIDFKHVEKGGTNFSIRQNVAQ